MNKHSEKVHQNEWMNTLQDNLFKKKTIETYRIFHSCRLSAFLKKDYFKCMHSPDVAQILKRHLNQNIVRNLKRNPEPFTPPPPPQKEKTKVRRSMPSYFMRGTMVKKKASKAGGDHQASI